ncbi:hypothetical protein [Nonomuraea rhodomycinica]|uniref:Uncharacterized protein n=1 Tax=Nonomuraea rhodomycinica TaxID=1712872 RepID=A0A7Y6IZF3_9ACTN|nr:hypothetical protein [Nonomuraea rhodomycinica]NUW46995.1 hypothetical protein [Nonomuraea rhodomycinica]
MIRTSQVEILKTAVRELDAARENGTKAEMERCLSVVQAAYRNASDDEVNAAIEW